MPNRIISESCNTSPTLAAVSLQAEVLFWHLTTRADDYGCFEANPRLVNCSCFPLRRLRDSEVERWLTELVSGGLVDLYEVGGKPYGAFKTWAKHQRKRESKPKFPLPDDKSAVRRGSPQSAANGGELPQLAARARTLGSRERETRDERRETRDSPRTAAAEPASPSGNGSHQEKLKPEDIAEAWNEHCGPLGLARVRELTGSRRDKVLIRLREHPEQQFWEEVLGAIPSQKFLLGKNDRKWRIDFDFLFDNDLNAVKVAEGKYGGT